MQFSSIVAAAGIGIACCSVAGAARAQENSNWIEAQSLRELPAGIQALLGVGLAPDNGGIADREFQFNEVNASEVNVALKRVPKRRFALGTFSDGKAVVAIEQGGKSYSVWGLEFRQVGDTWEVTRCNWLRKRPRRAPDLLAALDTGLPAEGWICPGPDRLTQVRPRPGA